MHNLLCQGFSNWGRLRVKQETSIFWHRDNVLQKRFERLWVKRTRNKLKLSRCSVQGLNHDSFTVLRLQLRVRFFTHAHFILVISLQKRPWTDGIMYGRMWWRFFDHHSLQILAALTLWSMSMSCILCYIGISSSRFVSELYRRLSFCSPWYWYASRYLLWIFQFDMPQKSVAIDRIVWI